MPLSGDCNTINSILDNFVARNPIIDKMNDELWSFENVCAIFIACVPLKPNSIKWNKKRCSKKAKVLYHSNVTWYILSFCSFKMNKTSAIAAASLSLCLSFLFNECCVRKTNEYANLQNTERHRSARECDKDRKKKKSSSHLAVQIRECGTIIDRLVVFGCIVWGGVRMHSAHALFYLSPRVSEILGQTQRARYTYVYALSLWIVQLWETNNRTTDRPTVVCE